MTVSQSDHFELARLVKAYCDGVIRRDVDTWSATWADESQWQMRGDPIVGKEAIVAFWLQAMEGFQWVVQTAPFSRFEVEPGSDRGTGRVVAQERFQRADGALGSLLAIYHDEYVRTDDGWKFASRKLEIRDFQ